MQIRIQHLFQLEEYGVLRMKPQVQFLNQAIDVIKVCGHENWRIFNIFTDLQC